MHYLRQEATMDKMTDSETQTQTPEHEPSSEAPGIATSEMVLKSRNTYSLPLDSNHNEEWIMLNVGGKVFTTTRSTLCNSEPTSMLARMFSKSNEEEIERTSLRPSPRDSSGAYLIDRSPRYFEPILNYLRHGRLIIDHDVNVQGVLEEAKFYGMASILPMLELETERWFSRKNQELMQSKWLYDESIETETGLDCSQSRQPPLTRRDVIKALMRTSGDTINLRFQGCNLAGADLSKLDLSRVNLKHANLRHTNLKGTNLSHCDLERADLFQSNLEGAQLIGANFCNTNLENSNFRGINAENRNDWPFTCTNFKGANLTNTNFEGSRLQLVNFVGSILKGSNFQNSHLDKADLSHANLENCDFSGSNMYNCNMDFSNIKGARFECDSEIN